MSILFLHNAMAIQWMFYSHSPLQSQLHSQVSTTKFIGKSFQDWDISQFHMKFIMEKVSLLVLDRSLLTLRSTLTSPAQWIRTCEENSLFIIYILKMSTIDVRMAERSKAPVSGTGPKGRGFKSHSWHVEKTQSCAFLYNNIFCTVN